MLAGVGLLTNNTVVIVASMLVSPIMGPILATTFGLVLKDRELALRYGVWNEVLSLLLCIVVGFCLGFFAVFALAEGGDPIVLGRGQNYDFPTNEMSGRATWSGILVGLAIAIPSGGGVGLSVLNHNTSSLVGVAISASLLPPAVNAGIMWAFAAFAEFPSAYCAEDYDAHCKFLHKAYDTDRAVWALGGWWSLALTLANIVCVFAVGYLCFTLKRVVRVPGQPDVWKRGVPAVREENRPSPALRKTTPLYPFPCP